MPLVFCTLFNSLYLDRGLVLFESLKKYSSEFKLYILCMDDKCFDVLNVLNEGEITPVKLSDFETPELLEVKPKRSFGEYCWTCTPFFIKYILKVYKEDHCAYLDSDMCFYSNPEVLLKELIDNNKSVLIVGHRFNKHEKLNEKVQGRFCVEYNLFINDDKAMSVLDKWADQCLDSVEKLNDGIHFGDQKYLDSWLDEYSFVMETSNLGAGVAPWNISQYRLSDQNNQSFEVKFKGTSLPIVFYHFENLTFLDDTHADIHVFCTWTFDKRLVDLLYDDYLSALSFKRKLISERFGIYFVLKKHPEMIDAKDYRARFKNFINRIKSPHGIGYIIFNRVPSFLFRKRNIKNFS